jgi:hypothetical protein
MTTRSSFASFSKTQESFLERILVRATTEMAQVHATALRQQQQEIQHLRETMNAMQDKQDTYLAHQATCHDGNGNSTSPETTRP